MKYCRAAPKLSGSTTPQVDLQPGAQDDARLSSAPGPAPARHPSKLDETLHDRAVRPGRHQDVDVAHGLLAAPEAARDGNLDHAGNLLQAASRLFHRAGRPGRCSPAAGAATAAATASQDVLLGLGAETRRAPGCARPRPPPSARPGFRSSARGRARRPAWGRDRGS
ncbi:MAG: hypothetical protein MZU95_10795 [Desulfomicrobium escambiense]|nr:hypothetical protein [Desulfomicrobium escambiense]